MSRLLIGGVLLYAGFMKAVGPSAEFAAALDTYKLFPSHLLSPLATGMPFVEMWIGLFVFTGLFTRPAALAAALLYAAFVAIIASTFLRGIDLASCGCFGAETLSPRYTIVLDTALLALSLTAYRQTKLPPPFSLDRIFP